MKERIKQIRKHLGMTQVEFGAKLGVKGNTVTQYETGRNTPADTVITLLCREYNVNEKWLRTGEGGAEAMFIKRSRKDEIGAFLGQLLEGEDDFKSQLVTVLAKLSVDEWELLEQIAKRLLDGMTGAAE